MKQFFVSVYRAIRLVYILFREAFLHPRERSTINVDTGQVIRSKG